MSHRYLLESTHGSQGSMTFDPHLASEILQKKRERNKRSETARRHVLSRQLPIEDHESPHRKKIDRRRSSTLSEHSISSRKTRSRRASSTSRTCSFDSRCTQPPDEIDVNELEPCLDVRRKQSPRKRNSINSTPSVEKEFRYLYPFAN